MARIPLRDDVVLPGTMLYTVLMAFGTQVLVERLVLDVLSGRVVAAAPPEIEAPGTEVCDLPVVGGPFICKLL